MNFNALLEAEQKSMLKYARYLCSYNEPDAEDLVHSAMIKALEHQHQFEPGTKFGAWVSTIMRNMFFSERLLLRNRMPHLEMNELLGPKLTADHIELALELSQVIVAMDRLSPFHRKILSLYALGHSCEEIAVIEGIAHGTVKSRIFRARTVLLSILSSDDNDGA